MKIHDNLTGDIIKFLQIFLARAMLFNVIDDVKSWLKLVLITIKMM